MGRGAGRGVPDGRSCASHGIRRKPCRTLLLLVVAAHGAASTGCSFIYVKGPQPEVQPPPPCTTSNTSPTADITLAVISVGAVVGGAIAYGSSQKQPGGSLGWNAAAAQVAGVGAMALGGIGTAVFVPSAITGFNRTADCRAWLQANPQYAPPLPPPPPPAETSSSLLVPARGCPSRGDAPLLCSSRASWETSALVLEVPSRGAR